jgi:hypothetical protein
VQEVGMKQAATFSVLLDPKLTETSIAERSRLRKEESYF